MPNCESWTRRFAVSTPLLMRVHRRFCLIWEIFVFLNLLSDGIAAEALRLILKKYSRSCVQYVLFNGKHPMTNIKSLSVMMQHAGYRRVTRVRTQRIATFISAKSPLWNASPVFSNKPIKTTL